MRWNLARNEVVVWRLEHVYLYCLKSGKGVVYNSNMEARNGLETSPLL